MKLSNFFAFLLTLAAVSVVSTSCKDDDSDDPYIPSQMSLNVDGFHVDYKFGTFNSYHSDELNPSLIVDYNKIINVTRYRADERCFVAYYSSKDAVNDQDFNDQVDEEYIGFVTPKEYNGMGVDAVLGDTVIGPDAIPAKRITYSTTDEDVYKFIFYYMHNPNNGRLYRLRVSGPEDADKFFEEADKVLATFTWE